MLRIICRSMFEFGTDTRHGLLAPVTYDHGFTFFDPQYRNEKQAQVMIHPPGERLM
jgi:hypothetical protein